MTHTVHLLCQQTVWMSRTTCIMRHIPGCDKHSITYDRARKESPSSWAAQGSPLPSKGCEKQDSATSSGWRTVCSIQARGSVSCPYPRLKALRSILSTILVTFFPCTTSSGLAAVAQRKPKGMRIFAHFQTQYKASYQWQHPPAVFGIPLSERCDSMRQLKYAYLDALVLLV